MTRIAAAFVFAVLGSGVAAAQTPKADCSLFKRSSDGRWISTVDSKIGNPKNFITLPAGKPIDRDVEVLGNNVSDTITRLCGDK